jgi:hypothetical protein
LGGISKGSWITATALFAAAPAASTFATTMMPTLPVGVESGLDLIEPPVQHKTNPERQNHDQQHHFDAHADVPDPVG